MLFESMSLEMAKWLYDTVSRGNLDPRNKSTILHDLEIYTDNFTSDYKKVETPANDFLLDLIREQNEQK